jgi:radical SAM protein with 4Fe4S-binding SPASM domain
MFQRFAKLTENWMMRGWSDLPFAVVNWKTCEVRPFDSKIAYVARSCDGVTDFNSLLFLPDHIAILNALIKHSVAEECGHEDPIEDYQHFRKAENPYLKGIHWAVTGTCNLKCRHCYMEAPSRRYADMNGEDVIRIIEQFVRANIVQVTITGGEPFVREDLLAIIETLQRKKIRVRQIYSNGLLITDTILKKIKDIGLSPAFCLSFDGCGTHDRMRGVAGTEQKVLDGIKRIRFAGFPITVTTAIDRISKMCLPETYRRMKELNIQSWAVAPPFETGNWCSAGTNLSTAEEVDVYTPILRLWHDDGMPFRLQLGAFFNSVTDSVGKHLSKSRRRYTPESYDCGVCRETPHLMSNGALLPCHAFSGTSLQDRMPNLRKQDLSEVWTRSNLQAVVNSKKKDLFQNNQECADCDLFESCGMGCRARALMETGDVSAKDPLMCEILKKGHKLQLLNSIKGSAKPNRSK